MWLQIAELGVILADQFYHRFMEQHPPPTRLAGTTVQFPRTDVGGPIPLVFGWTRVNQPFLAWVGPTQTAVATDDLGNQVYRTYAADMLFSCGIPMGKGFTRGARTTPGAPHLTRLWYGDRTLPPNPVVLPQNGTPVYDGVQIERGDLFGGDGAGGGVCGTYWWFGGWTDQDFSFPTTPTGITLEAYASSAGAGSGMWSSLPRQMCIGFHYYNLATGAVAYPDSTIVPLTLPAGGFCFGESPSMQGISVEVQTYGDVVSGVTQHVFSMNNPGVDFAGDADPAEVIYDILTGDFGKMGLDPSYIDVPSFMAASTTLKGESHGYSRAFEEFATALEMINEVLTQIDGLVYFDHRTKKIKLKLIRPDYDPNAALVITRQNCEELQGLALSSWSGVPNKVKVTYPDRSRAYVQSIAAAHNLANSLVQDAQQNEVTINYPGCTNLALALSLASRELAARSRPLMKCTAIVDRSFLRVNPGDVVKVRYTDPDVSDIIFRVAGVNRGTLKDNKIALSLIQDYFYVWRRELPGGIGIGKLGSATDVLPWG